MHLAYRPRRRSGRVGLPCVGLVGERSNARSSHSDNLRRKRRDQRTRRSISGTQWSVALGPLSCLCEEGYTGGAARVCRVVYLSGNATLGREIKMIAFDNPIPKVGAAMPFLRRAAAAVLQALWADVRHRCQAPCGTWPALDQLATRSEKRELRASRNSAVVAYVSRLASSHAIFRSGHLPRPLPPRVDILG